MSSKSSFSPEILRSHEEAFIQHYRWLLKWALQFSNNDRTRAEDLVQEVFAQFAFAHTDLSTIKNIPAYLYTTLRNTHVSEVRLAGRSHVQSQSIVEYSIADAALGGTDPSALHVVQDQLRRICQYACMRKQSSRAGSVLILRFFHGYHISEVAQVLGGTSQAVRQCLRFARNEARLFLDDPDALAFIDKGQAPRDISSCPIRSAEELLTDLRLAIFSSCEGECFAAESMRAFYHQGLILTVDNLTLAHIVSCRKCLDSANRELGLPLLAERHPADALGPDNSWRGGPNGSGGTRGNGRLVRLHGRGKDKAQQISRVSLLRCQRRSRELFEHHPRDLCVSVNGYLLGSQSVNSEMSRLRLDITIAEPLSFIEVMSEENARLLVMNIDAPPDGEPTQTWQVTLSEGRRIEAMLRYGHPWPMLEVVYEDPNFIAESRFATSDFDRMWEVNAAKVLSERCKPGPDECLELAQSAGGTADEGSPDLAVPASSSSPVRRYSFAKAWRLILSLWKHVGVLIDSWRRRAIRPLLTRPGFITGIVSLFLIGALLFVRLNLTPTVSAATLLERARTAETALTGGIDYAAYRIIKLEERDHPTGELIAQSRIEIWRDTKRNLSARRVYDEKGDLIAGEWIGSDAGNGLSDKTARSRAIYRRGQALQFDFSARTPQAVLRDLEVWRFEPSAREYEEMIGSADEARVSEGPFSYIISYTTHDVAGDNALLQATLTLRKSDLHPIEQTLVVQRGGEMREYRFVEASFERRSVDAGRSKVFEVDAELFPENVKGGGARTKREGDALRSSASVVATPDLEVEVAYLLDGFRVRFGDQINLTRTPEGMLRVNGIVDTDASKKEILHTLAPVLTNPAVRVEIDTAAEVLRRQQRSPAGQVIVRNFSGTDNAIPVYSELRDYVSQTGTSRVEEKELGPSSPGDPVDHAVRALATRVVSRSSRMLSHAIELKQLSERFSSPQLNVLTPDARAKWLRMIHNHAGALQRETSSLRRELQPIFFPTETYGVETEGGDIVSDAELASMIQRLYKLQLANDEAIRSAFTASSDVPRALGVKTPRFLVSLATTESLAGSIRRLAAKG